MSFFLYTRAPWISLHILHEIRCCELLQLLAFSLPLCSIHTCIHAWYFSTRRTTVPAVSQLLEQFARVSASYVIYLIFLEQNLAPTPILAVGGMLFGELTACFFCVLCLAFQKPAHKGTAGFRVRSCLWEILTLSVPLTLNRMLVNLLQSTEAILIPGKLEASGLTNVQSPSLYGALTGMHCPLFYFLLRSRPPSPRCSSQPSPDSRQPEKKMPLSALPNKRFNTVCCSAFIRRNLLLFRKRAGTDLLPKPGRRHLFTDPGIPLSFPLSHRHSDRDPERPGTHRPMPDSEPRRPWNPNPLRDLRNPPHGIRGYLFGLLLSQLIITGLNLIFLHKSVKFRFPAVEWIVLPCCGMILGCGCGLFLYRILSEMKMSGYIALFGSVFITGGIFLLMMKLFNQKTPR